MSKILYFDDLEDFFGSEEWKLTIDVSDIWNKYNNDEINIVTYNSEYYNRLIQYQKNINGLGDDIWSDISKILPKLKEANDDESSISIYNQIYDWADKNDIHIKTK